MPDEIEGSGGTPFVPDGTGTTGVGSVVVAVTDPEPVGDDCAEFEEEDKDPAGVEAGLAAPDETG
jgi:hypothetical protein